MTVNSEHLRAFRQDLLQWYRGVARDLPWRRTADPYLIWVSEIMLQQTRVDQVIPYFERFVFRFPNIVALAEADLEDVLVAWEGLGYYSRARNLHKAARQVVEDHGGVLPATEVGLRELPGIGLYTSAAIASIAFGEPVAAVDGNVTRVVARIFAIRDDVKSTPVKKQIRELAQTLIAPADPGGINEAIMELGATVCTPKHPDCGGCPLSGKCGAYAENLTEAIPFSAKKRPTPHYDVSVGVIRDGRDRILVVRREDDGLLGGLWEFPGPKVLDGESSVEACRRGIREKLGLEVEPVDLMTTFKHQYSHFGITVKAFECVLQGTTETTGERGVYKWLVAPDLADVPMHRSSRRIADRVCALI